MRSATLRRRILLAIAGLGAGAACRSEPSGPTTNASTTGSATAVGSGAPFDTELKVDPRKTRECVTKTLIAAAQAAAKAPDAGPMAAGPGLVCPSANELIGLQLFPSQPQGWFPAGGPVEWKGDCCYLVGHALGGRPFVVAGHARRADVTARCDWGTKQAADARGTERLTTRERRALAAAWLEDARMEHASIASFARFSLELMSVGAPPEFVADAHRAALDEIEHARISFALVRRYIDAPCGPGPLDLSGMVAPTGDLVDAATAAIREGCVGETEAALVAGAQLDAARDPVVRRALARIARDEARHAELAWRFVAWAIRAGGARVEHAVARALDDVCRAPAVNALRGDPDTSVRAGVWQAHGRLSAGDINRVLAEARDEVIAFAAKALAG